MDYNFSFIASRFLNHSESSVHQLWKKTIPDELKDAKHGIVMGVASDKCDNGKVLFIKFFKY